MLFVFLFSFLIIRFLPVSTVVKLTVVDCQFMGMSASCIISVHRVSHWALPQWFNYALYTLCFHYMCIYWSSIMYIGKIFFSMCRLFLLLHFIIWLIFLFSFTGPISLKKQQLYYHKYCSKTGSYLSILVNITCITFQMHWVISQSPYCIFLPHLLPHIHILHRLRSVTTSFHCM